MPLANMLSITSNEYLSMVIWIVLLLAALYFARRPFHRAVDSFTRIIHNAMRLIAASILSVEKELSRRNHEVLMAAGLEKSERLVEREFNRISAAVVRDLASFPHLQRRLLELTTRLDEDYSSSADVPPSLPNWLPIIESIARIEHTGDSMVANMLGEINRTLSEQHKSAIENYRKSNSLRHGILNKMMPLWRKSQKIVDDAASAIANLNKRANSIDRYMDEYEQIRLQTDKAARMLSASSLTQFFISSLLLTIAFGAALINFNLIAPPMVEIIGEASHIGPYQASDVAGLVIILIELTMGLFLMESLRITRLFPIISSMDDKMRRRIIWIALALLTILAGVESALAFISDRVIWEAVAAGQTLKGAAQVEPAASMIPAVGKMIMGFFFPFILAFVAIPLESFFSSARTILGIVAIGMFRLISFLLRLVGNIVYYFGRFIINLYDLLIFPSIWLEGVLTGNRTNENDAAEKCLSGKECTTEEAVDGKADAMDYKRNPE